MDAIAPPARSPCHANSRRCSDARSYRSVLRECCRGHVIQISRDVAEVLNDAGVTWWADYGTLLGAVRNPMTTKADYPWLPQDQLPDGPIPPGIIPHDKDSDWCVLMRDWVQAQRALYTLARKANGKRGYSLRVRPHRGSIKVRLSRINHTNLDLFFYMKDADGKMWRRKYIQADRFKGRDLTEDQVFPLTTVKWEGLTLMAPKNPAAFLEYRYGPNWRTPIAANNDGIHR